MDKLEKIVNIISAILLVIIVVIIIVFIFAFKEMMNDYRCSQLLLNEFFQDEKCERYWKYREVEDNE